MIETTLLLIPVRFASMLCCHKVVIMDLGEIGSSVAHKSRTGVGMNKSQFVFHDSTCFQTLS